MSIVDFVGVILISQCFFWHYYTISTGTLDMLKDCDACADMGQL